MSIFEKVTGELKAAELQRVDSEEVRLDAEQQAREKFKVDFLEAWESIAKPVFHAFVSDAKAHGYDAKVVELSLNTSKYGGSVFLMPVAGDRLSNGERTYLQLSGEPFDQAVQLATSFDLSSGKTIPTYGLEFIRRDRLEAALEAFLRSALQSFPPAKAYTSESAKPLVSLKDLVPPILLR